MRPWPPNVKVVDFGIRGFDLAYALIDAYEVVILVDAIARGDAPGTIYTIEPDLPSAGDANASTEIDTHGMSPVKVLRLAASLGEVRSRVLLVGCEPTPFVDEDMQMGLSPPVQAALDVAVTCIEQLVAEQSVADHVASRPTPVQTCER